MVSLDASMMTDRYVGKGGRQHAQLCLQAAPARALGDPDCEIGVCDI